MGCRCASHASPCTHETLWRTAGKSYPEWVCSLASSLIRDCYHSRNTLSPPQSATQSQPHAQSQPPLQPPPPLLSSHSSSTLLGAAFPTPYWEGKDPFIACLGEVCALNADVAAAAFPLVVQDLLTHMNMNVSSNANDELSRRVASHMLHKSCTLPQVTPLPPTIYVPSPR